MRLVKAASFFNKTPCVDAYSGVLAFKGQLATYDDSKRDSITAERRILSVAPDVVLPARKAVRIGGEAFILGTGQVDVFKGAPVRRDIVAHYAPMLFTVRTLAQACSGLGGTQAYGNRAWIKNAAYTDQTSELVPQYQLFFAEGEPVSEESLITVGGVSYLVRTIIDGATGILTALAEQLDAGSVAPASVRVATYSKVSGATTYAATATQVVSFRWQALFKYGDKLSPKYGPDERQIAVLRSAVPSLTVGSHIDIESHSWRVSAIDTLHPLVWLCRCSSHD